MLWKIEAKIRQAVEDGVLPGAVLFARDKSGKINFSSAIGHASLDPSTPMTLDTVFTLASMTKLLTCIATLQLVERDLITLDTDIAQYLPSLAAKPILTGFDSDGSPVLVPRTRPIRLRHLLTHSSGCGYSFLDPRLMQYLQCPGVKPLGDPAPISAVEDRFDFPLLFEPGAGWAYGCGIDWAGKVVEILSGEKDLESYFGKYILAPLGIPTTTGRITFYPPRADPAPALAQMTTRDKTSGRVVPRPLPIANSGAAFGGEGGYADLGAYMTVLYSLLLDDGKLLQPKTAAELFKPWLREPEAKAALLANVKHPEWIVGWVPDTGEYDWGLGGLLVDGDGHGHRKRGFLLWGGVFNLAWFIDRESGVCGILGTQVLVPADPQIRLLIQAFEEEIYAKL